MFDILNIKDPQFLKTLSKEELNQLSKDIRLFLIKSLSKTGGHLSSNLGVVDLTIAMHYVFNTPEDKFIFDVGHQCYTHKILTGRTNQFDQLRKYQGLSGFQKLNESAHDPWEAGHASTSLSAATGYAIGRDLNKENYHVVAVIGDGALTGGMALEALDHIGGTKTKVIIILNDNEMSISKNVGGVNELMGNVRLSMKYNKLKHNYKEWMQHNKVTRSIYHVSKSTKDFVKKNVVNSTIFKDFGIEYIGPVDGHDYRDLIRALNKAKNEEGPVVVHVMTKKGRGYRFCEADHQGKWHGVDPFNIKTGESLVKEDHDRRSWSEIIANHVAYKMHEDSKIVTITPAMIKGSKLESIFEQFPDRSFDVGIAEEHAVTFAGALTLTGHRPFLSIYSSFLQRAYDQVNHDVARMNLPVVFGVDRAGLVGDDGATHQGVFDISFLLGIPNIVLCMPKDQHEAQLLLNTGFNHNGPYFMRYPRGKALFADIHTDKTVPVGKWEIVNRPAVLKGIILSYGPSVQTIMEHTYCRDHYLIVNARYLKPMDEEMLSQLAALSLPIYVYETSMKQVSLGTMVIQWMNDMNHDVMVHHTGIEDHYVEQGSIDQLQLQEGIDFESFLSLLKK